MILIVELVIFLASFFLLTWLNARLMKDLTQLSKFLGIKEFIIAFFILGLAVNLPNLFVDVGSALRNLPQISIGDMIGGNLVDLTLVLALGIFFSKKFIPTDSRMVQGSAIFTFFIALFPLLLLLKGSVTRIDGVLLIAAYFVYTAWAFSKDDRFKKEFHGKVHLSKKQLTYIAVEVVAILLLLLFVSQEIINFTTSFASGFGASLSLVSLLLVGLANCFPEMYITIVSIRKGQHWVVLGDLMSSVIGAATLVFGLVALVHPFVIQDIGQLFIARIFLVVAAIFFLLSMRTGNKLTKKEGLMLLFLYIAFLIVEVFVK
jgi:cation:H+ antiporter